MPSPLQLFLFRHGETEWSRLGRHTSRSEIPLTARGEDEARVLREKIARDPFSHVLVSPRERARRTCELAGLDAVSVVEPLLREWDYGDFEGLTSPEILERQPDWNLFRHGCPKGESPAEVATRADHLIRRLRSIAIREKAESPAPRFALFSHGHFLRALGARWVGWPVEAGQRLYLHTGTVSVLAYEHQREDEPVIEVWNAR